ncbi:MAG TPA: RagB/SusD family nutrient uptake outer membrane protein [Longimicrobium sp.]|uniref:RagB/SusD family nutrient uptake outer membrane protein n=1 Tax=Longimicrobium sp. TaxID=2029185 RepID=UPI002ED85F42
MTRRMIGMRRPLALLAVLSATAAGACGDLTVPDYNNPAVDEFVNNPTPGAVRAAATGLQIGARLGLTDRTGYVAMLGVVGRESYIIDSSDPRYVSELLQGPLSNSGAFGAGMWTPRYANIRGANLLLAALENAEGFTPAEMEAIRGWAKTFQALDFLLVINTRDVNGAPIAVEGDVNAPAPFVGKAAVFQHIVALLEQGRTHLQAGGASFPFSIGRGLSGFDTPQTFLQLNRALRARVAVYMGDYAGAVTLFPQTFLNTAGELDAGAYHTYASSEGQGNDLANEFNYARPALVTDAETQAGSTALDRRVLQKIGPHPSPRSQQGVSSDKAFLMYPDASADLPLIDNEELILLRAEARWFTGNKAGAMADLNLIRAEAGGLAPIAGVPATDAAFVDLLLKERKYSLMFEGHRWIDARRFGRLDTLGRDVSTHVIVPRWAIPESECLARGLPSPCDLGA